MKNLNSKLPKNKNARIFLKAMLITLGVLLSLLLVLAVIAAVFFNRIHIAKISKTTSVSEAADKTNTDEIPQANGEVCKNILVFGVDEGAARTDTIMLVHFNSQTSQVAVVSIPRDTKVTWTPEQQDKAIELGRLYSYTSKITDMSSLGGIENLRYFTIASIEDMLNITVDNYVVVNTKMLRDVVDKIGGVEVNVPRAMQYRDNWQDLTIDLQPGLQTLNGAQAEGLLRWRHNKDYSEQYAEGDLGRIETQQLFIKAFAHKILSIRSFTKLTGLVTSAYNNVTTDIDLSDAISYLSYLPSITADNIIFKTLPGQPVEEDRSYYIVDEEEAKDYISLIFTNDLSIEASPSSIEVSSSANNLDQ